MKVLVTGATGFVGLNIVQALTNAECDVHAFVRPSSKLEYLTGFDVHFHSGELDDRQALKKAMTGLDAVIHSAGVTSCYESDYPNLYEVNVRGTENVIEAALETGIGRLVYTSTTSTIGAVNDNCTTATEETELCGFRSESPYCRTKFAAEKLIQAAQRRSLDSIILNPAEVLGAFDYTMNWGSLVLAMAQGHLPFLPPGSGSFCQAEEVGRAHLAALTKGRPGQRYILGGTNISYQGLIDAIADVTGNHYSLPEQDYQTLYYQAIHQAEMFKYDGKRPMVDPYRMRVFKGHYLFNSDKAQRELGYCSLPLKDMIQTCHNWYKTNGFL